MASTSPKMLEKLIFPVLGAVMCKTPVVTRTSRAIVAISSGGERCLGRNEALWGIPIGGMLG